MENINNELPIRLIALDLDGTVLNSQKVVTPLTREAIIQAAEKGAHIVPASGRPMSGLSQEILGIPGVDYAITCNGASVHRLSDMTQIYSNNLDTEIAIELQKRFEELHIMTSFFQFGKSWSPVSQFVYIDQLGFTDEMTNYIKTNRQVHPCPAEQIRAYGNVEKFVLNFIPQEDGTFLDREKVLEIAKDYPELTLCSGGLNNLEFTAPGVTKGAALLVLADLLGLDPKQTLACGDSENDYAMLKAAHIGVAMANSEVIVKEIADYITLDNDHDGVAVAINKFVK